MILNIKSYLLKIDIYSILVLLIFLAAPLRFYVSTSIILEIVTFGLVVWGFAKHKFPFLDNVGCNGIITFGF